MLLVAHNEGDTMGAAFPKRVSLKGLGQRTLSTDLAELVGRGKVRIRVTGEVADMEGYPPLPEPIRARIRESEWTLPADLTVGELEGRLAERLRTEFDLGDASASIDERGRATVAAAPPFSGLSKRVPEGRRAVSIDALVPTGLARGDEVPVDRWPAAPTAESGVGTGTDQQAPGSEPTPPAGSDESRREPSVPRRPRAATGR